MKQGGAGDPRGVSGRSVDAEYMMSSETPPLVIQRRAAMATEFQVKIVHEDPVYARQAALAALHELDRLESLLSRFVAGSDIGRLQAADAGQTVAIAPETFDCLQIALHMEAETDGAFNIAFRHQSQRPAAELLKLASAPPRVICREEHVPLDLGGIAKGFALDYLAEMLRTWDITCFLLQASLSTLLAGEPPPGTPGWLVAFGPTTDRRRLQLRLAAISGSGTPVKGPHIVDPRSGRAATHHQLAWAGAKEAATADALSTAMIVMHPTQLPQFTEHHRQYPVWVLPAGSSRLRVLGEPVGERFR